MTFPLFVRTPTNEEQAALERALRSDVAFTLRRAQILRLSACGKRSGEISANLGCCPQTVRNVIRDFNERGVESFQPRKPGPKNPDRLFSGEERKALVELAHRSPRAFSKERSTWTLDLLAEVAFEEGLTSRLVSDETIRQAILAMGHSWQRAKDWIQSPDPQYALKKSSATA